jgi:CYTH domain-containing protein
MAISLKYAVVERERRFLVASLPAGAEGAREVVDHYLVGTRLRLREVREADGTVVRKLGHKVRLDRGPAEVACTNLYLDEAEWALLSALPARRLRKRRHLVRRDGWVVAIDEHEDGTLVAEVDDGDRPAQAVPEWLDVIEDVSDDEAWTGARLAH